ncbi:monovalent cation/H+ antiporter complex subunit F [Oceanimonas sp. CHS3-5]|uniref:monovalent cation/H+ antiporter complex subunit F n=1 Tax=Oceanimonas sp. CHS3-5 TaxID=3068186 RepID=UPI00273CF7A4|nr:monovalent cation/H+ antiporter complex subunit F [Oceanimonas sp. CHS3-5]MDP5292949.1 monovalent cation/H+ antiporter complex subunit F [Oceanimonas sp. CHS3-5]
MFELALTLSFIFLSLGLVLATVRLLIGPTLPDRVVALEVIASLTIGFILLYSVAFDTPVLIDVVIVLALTSFMAAVGFARYLEQGGQRDDD